MTMEVDSGSSLPISDTTAATGGGLSTSTKAEITAAADRVGADRVSASLGADNDGYVRDKPPPEPVQVAKTGGLNVPTGRLGGSGSPISSSAVVGRMGELGAMGSGAAQRFDRSQYQDLLNRDGSQPFTGSGATGQSPTQSSIPAGDLAALARYHQAEKDVKTLQGQLQQLGQARLNRPAGISDAAEQRRQEALTGSERILRGNLNASRAVMDQLAPTVDSYRNPLSGALGASQDPKEHFDARTRERQAQLMLNQPINTLHREAYGDKVPTRAEVIEAAARKYNLDPAVLSGVMLHEQRDQSAREDAAEYGGATLAGRDNSLGMGQVLMSTAMRDNADLLSDTVDAKTRASLSRNDVARLLTSDEHNIYATARYLRSVADQGAAAGANPGSLPATRASFPGLDTDAYRGARWSDANIRAIASEYTSKPWDDRVITPDGYPQFVLDAVQDVRRSGVFKPR